MKVDVVKTGQQLRGEQACTIASADSASSSIKIRKKEVEKSSKSIRSGKSLAMSRWAKPLACWEKRDQSWGKNSISPSLFWPIWQENMPTSLGAISQVSTAGLGPHLACTPTPPFYSKCICPLLWQNFAQFSVRFTCIFDVFHPILINFLTCSSPVHASI